MAWQTISDAGNPYKTKMKIEPNGGVTVENEQTNMSEILKVNRALSTRDRKSSSLFGGENKVLVARIPEIYIERWLREEGLNFYRLNEEDKARLFAKLNDPEWSGFRTAPGKI
jgi:hypothetical protein